MELSIWYHHMMKHEAGEDTFIPDEENEMKNEEIERIKPIHKPTPIGEDRQRIEPIYHWVGGPNDELRYPPPSEEFIRAAKIIDAHLRIRLVPSRP